MIPRAPPISDSRNPIANPPKAPNQLIKEKATIRMPHSTCSLGLFRIITAQAIMRIPHSIPGSPIQPPIPPKKKVKADPTTATKIPTSRTKMPPMKESSNAVVGTSTDSDKQSRHRLGFRSALSLTLVCRKMTISSPEDQTDEIQLAILTKS